MLPLIQPVIDLMGMAAQALGYVTVAVAIASMLMRQIAWFSRFD